MENDPAREQESGQSLSSRLRSNGRRVLEYARNPHQVRLEIEQRREQWVGFEATARTLEKTDGVARYKRNIGRKAVAYFQENILLETPRNHPEHFEEKLHEYAATGEYWPIILGTHKAHPAGFPLIEEAKYIESIFNQYSNNDEITGSLLLIANTMKKGKKNQSEDIVEYLELVAPIFEKYNTETALVLRGKDAKKLTKEERRNYSVELGGKLDNLVQAGQIPLILPEATVESGRQKPGGVPGEINGMVYLEKDSVSSTAKRVREQGKEPLFIFVGTTGENKIYNPITEKVTMGAKAVAIVRETEGGKQYIPPIMRSVVDYPMPLRDIERQYGDSSGKLSGGILEWVCGHMLARLLPPKERGVFLDDDLLDIFGAPSGRRNTDFLDAWQ